MPLDNGKLASLRVLDLSSVGPASRASRILADYGAEVVKVAPVSRKGSLQIRPPYYSYGGGRGMKRFCVDLKDAEGKKAFLALAAGADVLIESFRPGVAARIGIGYEQLKALNQSIVYCSTSGYGQDGPYSQRAGHDLNYLAVGGFLHCSGRRADGAPAIPGATVADSAAGGMQAVISILAALVAREKSGEGSYLDVSVADGVLQLMSLHIDRYLATGEEAGPGGDVLTGRYACYDVYRTRDGKWLSVGAIEPAFFANLCRALDLEEYVDSQNDDDRQDEIRQAFARAFSGRDRDEWIAELGDADVCIAPVYEIPELAKDAQFVARNAFRKARRADGVEFAQLGPLLAGATLAPGAAGVDAGGPAGRSTASGQDCVELPDPRATDTDELLQAAGMSLHEIESLRERGVIE